MAAVYNGDNSTDWGYASATADSIASVGSTSMQATANNDGSIDLSWTLPPNNYTDDPRYEWRDGLEMVHATAADGSGTISAIYVSHDGDTGVCTADVTGLIGGTHYYFAETASKFYGTYYSSGDVIYGSADATTTGSPTTAPVAPDHLTAALGDAADKVALAWHNNQRMNRLQSSDEAGRRRIH